MKLIVHARAAYDLLDDDKCTADAKYTLDWLLANHTEYDDQGRLFMRHNGLHSSSRFKNSKVERVTKALDLLHERNILSPPAKLPTRKPTKIRYVNPLLFNSITVNDRLISTVSLQR